ncbi:MAG: quinolinate synthase NadA [Phycisphaerae bacterium]|nr:quinolinate synthase NadA [Phycisphaerae bacterium]
MSREALRERVARRKRELGSRLVVLGHHYQSDDVASLADFVGDSLKLSQQAAALAGVEYVVFCGVHFMAESADVLSPGATVVLPHASAGCAMADMAEDEAVSRAIAEVASAGGGRAVPITYVNSTAAVKAATARAGGACCTSSNVRNVFAWALAPAGQGGAGADKIFAIPDENLGLNTAVAMGFGPADCVVYDPRQAYGGLDVEQIRAARFILWRGHCYVHQRFTADHVRAARQHRPGVRVMAHPECPREVVALADEAGSTEQIIRAVANSPDVRDWAIATESNLVNRLAKQHPDKCIRTLGDADALCIQMGRVDLPHLLWALDSIADGKPANVVHVPQAIADDARTALERMIAIP